MLQKPWFKLFILFLATFFFFLAAEVVIAIFRPGPSQADIMQYMMGMMRAMHSGIRGDLMGMNGHTLVGAAIATANRLAGPVILGSVIIGLIIRLRPRKEAVHVRSKKA
jgi:hypothetical protein